MSSPDSSSEGTAAWPWTFFVIGMGFALYWISTAILWFPRTMASAPGLVLLFALTLIAWTVGILQTLKRWPGRSWWAAAASSALVVLTVSFASDLVFVGAFRGALDQLVSPITLTLYACAAVLPFLLAAVARGWLRRHVIATSVRAIVWSYALGFVAMAVVAGIMAFDIRIATA